MSQWFYDCMILWFYSSMLLWFYNSTIQQFNDSTILQFFDSTILWSHDSTECPMPCHAPRHSSKIQPPLDAGAKSEEKSKEQWKKKEKQQQTNENPSYFASVFLLFCRSLHRLQWKKCNQIAIELQWDGEAASVRRPCGANCLNPHSSPPGWGKGWAALLHWFWGGFQVFWGSWEQQERLLEGYCPCPIPAPTASSRPRAASSDPPCGVMKCSPNIPPEAQVGHREHAILCFSLYLFTLPRLLFYSTELPWHPKSFLLGKSKKAFLLILFSVTFEYSFTELFLQHCLSVRNKCRSQLHRLHFWVCNSSYVCMHLIFVSNNNN